MAVIRMDAIIAARYALLVMHVALHFFPTTYNMKYLPRYNGEGEVTVEEHLVVFYIFANNFNIDYADVWMRLFVQSLDGEVRKWFIGLAPTSIADIEIKPTEASAKINYANAFDAEFSLLLRERKSTTLLSMQEATIEVEYNILASNKLKTRSKKEKKK
jgi:hypothetical protein